jgi:hypothetical protein
MKIEVGKFYKTRDGRKARIYAVDGRDYTKIHGAVFEDGGWASLTWFENGIFYIDGKEYVLDLVSEWEEPKPRMLAYFSRYSGEVFLFSSKPAASLGFEPAPWLDQPLEGNK